MATMTSSALTCGVPQSRTTEDGLVLTFRPITAKDADLLADFATGLSYATRYFRFGHGDTWFTREQLVAFCRDPGKGQRHWVVIGDEGGKPACIASGGYVLDTDWHSCELVILVADAWQGTQVAHWLLETLVQAAQDDGAKRMMARVLVTNIRMLRFAKRHGFAISSHCVDLAILTLVRPLRGDS